MRFLSFAAPRENVSVAVRARLQEDRRRYRPSQPLPEDVHRLREELRPRRHRGQRAIRQKRQVRGHHGRDPRKEWLLKNVLACGPRHSPFLALAVAGKTSNQTQVASQFVAFSSPLEHSSARRLKETSLSASVSQFSRNAFDAVSGKGRRVALRWTRTTPTFRRTHDTASCGGDGVRRRPWLAEGAKNLSAEAPPARAYRL